MKTVKRCSRVVSALLCASAVLNAASAANGLQETKLSEPDGTEVFIRLRTPSVAEANAEALRTQGAFLDAAAQKQHAAAITLQQAEFAARLQDMGFRPKQAQRVGANGLRVRATAAQIAQLRAMPEVRSVAKVERLVYDNIDSVPWIGVQAAWARGLTGEGITVGIIDTGIDYTHAAFGGSGEVADYETNDPNVVEPGTFPTAKVLGGYDFAGAEYDADDPDSVPVEDEDPLDVQGHGSHVAGTAAGIGVRDSVGPGVAKDAKLYALKVFGDNDGSTELTSLAIEWAMDPNGDGDMADRLDVINMSLGSPFGSPDDPSSISSDNAVATGMVVVTSAGNESNVPYVTGAPGVAARAISTAASIPGGRDRARFTVTAPADLAETYPSEEGAGPVRFEDVGPVSGPLVPAEPRDGCAPLTNASVIAGTLALVIRGTCDFLVKAENAQENCRGVRPRSRQNGLVSDNSRGFARSWPAGAPGAASGAAAAFRPTCSSGLPLRLNRSWTSSPTVSRWACMKSLPRSPSINASPSSIGWFLVMSLVLCRHRKLSARSPRKSMSRTVSRSMDASSPS